MQRHNSTNQDPDQEIIDLARAALDDSIEHLDASVLSRLNQARHQALQPQSAGLWDLTRFGNWLPAGATAAAAVFALTIALPATSPLTSSVEDMSLPNLAVEDTSLAALEDSDLLEDLDMMLWLLDADDHAS
jgi:hypothetical protein